VLRDASASRTLAGGPVLDPQAPVRYRQRPERLRYLNSQRQPDGLQRLSEGVAALAHGLDACAWLQQQGWVHWPEAALAQPGLVWSEHSGWAIGLSQLESLRPAVLQALKDYHARHPEELGPESQRCRRLCASRLPAPLWSLLVQRLEQAGVLSVSRGFLHLPEHGAQLRAAEQVVAERVLPLLLEGRFDPPWIRTLATDTGLPETQVRSVLGRLAGSAAVSAVVKDLYYHPDVVREMAALVRRLAAEHGQISAAHFRDATGLGRKRAIQVLEFFDRIGFLRRVGDAHLLRPGTTLFMDDAKSTP
jgi:selenocysteine-specific elongation factor